MLRNLQKRPLHSHTNMPYEFIHHLQFYFTFPLNQQYLMLHQSFASKRLQPLTLNFLHMLEYLKSALNLNVFVEGGTYRGGTAQKMSHTFNKVITIEKSDAMYKQAKEKIISINKLVSKSLSENETVTTRIGKTRIVATNFK